MHQGVINVISFICGMAFVLWVCETFGVCGWISMGILLSMLLYFVNILLSRR